MTKELFTQFETNTTKIQIFKTDINVSYETDVNFVSEDLYMIVSTNKFTGYEYVRFGNYAQMRSIEKTYKGKTYFKL